MHFGDLVLPSGDQALHFHRIFIPVRLPALPRLPNGSVLLRIRFIHSKEEISACRYLIKLPSERRVLRCVFYIPCVEKCQNRTVQRRSPGVLQCPGLLFLWA